MNFHSLFLFLPKPFVRLDRTCFVPPPNFGYARARAAIIWRPNQTDVAQNANSQAPVKVDGALTWARRVQYRLLKRLQSGSDVALHRKQRWNFVWRKKWQRKFFLFVSFSD